MTSGVDDVKPDWSREQLRFCEWNPGKRMLAAIRLYQACDAHGLAWWPMKKLAVLRHRFWSVASGADIPLNCNIAGGLLMPHPNGIVIHPDTQIGPNCLIMQQVTLGVRHDGQAPRLGGHVDIGAGAKILGGVHLGAHCVIGANAVVLRDVPQGATAVGVPARLVSHIGTP